MLSESNKLVLWNPHQTDRFVVGSNHLQLYQSTNTATDPCISDSNNIHINSLQLTSNTNDTDTNKPDNKPKYKLIDTISYNNQTITKLQWCTNSTDSLLLGCTMLNGRLGLVRFSDTTNSIDDNINKQSSTIIKEFIPRYNRIAYCLSWNEYYTNVIAVGLDRVRNGFGTIVWDITTQGTTQYTNTNINDKSNYTSNTQSNSTLYNINTSHTTECVTEPLTRTSNSEASVSMSWLPSDQHSLAVGTSFKWLRIYDIRQGNTARPLSVLAHSKAVYGVKFDKKYQHNRLMTYSDDGVVKIWDIRKLTRGPLIGIQICDTKIISQRPKLIVDCDWSPTVNNTIATIQNDESVVRLWNVNGYDTSSVDNDKTIDDSSNLNNNNNTTNESDTTYTSIESIVSSDIIPCTVYHPKTQHNQYTSLSWHPTQRKRLLTVTSNGLLEDITLKDAVPSAINTYNQLTLAYNGTLYIQTLKDEHEHDIDDISTTIRQRIDSGYGFDPLINMSIIQHEMNKQPNNTYLHSLRHTWQWLSDIELLRNELAQYILQSNTHLPSMSPRSSIHNTNTPTVTLPRLPSIYNLLRNINTTQPIKISNVDIYDTSAVRAAIIRLCGMYAVYSSESYFDLLSNMNNDTNDQLQQIEQGKLEQYVQQLESQQQYDHAAFMCVVHMNFTRAVQCLTNSNNNTYQIIGIALQSIIQSNGMKQITNNTTATSTPYINSIFTLITGGVLSADNTLLNDINLSLQYRIGIAVRFLNDVELQNYITNVINKSLLQTNLSLACILDVSNNELQELLQQYIDDTSDIQSIALITGLITASNSADNIQLTIQRYIALYKELLNQWSLFTARAKLDVAWSTIKSMYMDQNNHKLNNTKNELNKPGISVRCNFCGQNLSYDALTTVKTRSLLRGRSTLRSSNTIGPDNTQQLISGCSACRKSLPRCSVCLLSMDIVVPPSNTVLLRQSSIRTTHSHTLQTPHHTMNYINTWFTWCQSCRHGGHNTHIQEWFQQHNVCPVSNCHCNCMQL